MASSPKQQVGRPKREVSYFGPIFIAAYPIRRAPENTGQATPTTVTLDKGTITEKFDISKYKIPQGDESRDTHLQSRDKDKKYRQKTESPKHSPRRFLKQMKIGIGERLHVHRHNNNHRDVSDKTCKLNEYGNDEKTMDESGTVPSNFYNLNNKVISDYHEHLLPRVPHDSPHNSEDYGSPESLQEDGRLVRADSIDDTYDTLPDINTFKISSTEDNYLRNRVVINGQYSDSHSDATLVSSKGVDTTVVSEHCNVVSVPVNDVSDGDRIDHNPSDGYNGVNLPSKDHRIFKHREMIARLKRKFFESPPKRMRPLELHIEPPIERTSENATNTEEAKDKTLIKDNVTSEPKRNTNTDVSEFETRREKVKKHFATESRASRLRNSGKCHGRPRRHSLDGKLCKQNVDTYTDNDWGLPDDVPPTDCVAVVAIDFGTSQSGYAYSFLHEPGTIHTMRRQDSGEPGVFNQKIPTTILLRPDGSFHSFGYGAIEFYHDLEPKEAAKWLFLDRFKMKLFHEKTLGKTSILRSVSGKDISAMTIFALSLRYFKDLVLEELSDQSDFRISTDVIRWVITVPAIWKASAKQFMRQAAYEAGLVHASRPDQLLIALEPEAASIYCRKLRLLQVLESSSTSLSRDQSRASTLSLPELTLTDSSHISNDLSVGTRYLVVDCGGGTVDITVHEILQLGRLKELHRASGGAHGSTGVDAEFEKLLKKIFGDDVILHFKRKRPSGWVELMAMFESRKRVAGPYRTSHISVSLPFSFIDFFKKCRVVAILPHTLQKQTTLDIIVVKGDIARYESLYLHSPQNFVHGSSVDSAVKKYGDPEITWTNNGMLKLSPRAMRRLFLPTIDGMKQAIGVVLNSPNTRGLSYMFLVGGFAESSMVQHEVRKDFGKLLKIIIPPGVGMTILKGAVYFGLDPDVVSERRSCQTYGVGVLHRFDPLIHPESRRISKDGIDWCTDIFDVFVRVNQSVALGDKIIRRYTPVRRNQSTTTIHIYSTEREDVLFISDDDVTRCGTLSLSLDGTGMVDGSRREIRAEMTFGDTEIKVRATDVISGRCVESSIDFINL